MGLFEVGLVYKKNGRFHIAVDSGTLISCRNGRTIEVRPTAKCEVVRSVSVEEISEQWKVTLREFDKLIGEFLSPPPGAKTRPRGSRRSSQNEEDYWKRARTGRIARPRL